MSEPRGRKSSLDRAAQTGSCRLVGGSGAPSDQLTSLCTLLALRAAFLASASSRNANWWLEARPPGSSLPLGWGHTHGFLKAVCWRWPLLGWSMENRLAWG